MFGRSLLQGQSHCVAQSWAICWPCGDCPQSPQGSVAAPDIGVLPQRGPFPTCCGPESRATAILKVLDDRKFDWCAIASGRPTQNVFIDKVNGCLRDEPLNETLFPSPHPARGRAGSLAQGPRHRTPASAAGPLPPSPRNEARRCTTRQMGKPQTRSLVHPGSRLGQGHRPCLHHALAGSVKRRRWRALFAICDGIWRWDGRLVQVKGGGAIR
jgi:hypothetical protein